MLLIGSANAPGLAALQRELLSVGLAVSEPVLFECDCIEEVWKSILHRGVRKILDKARIARYGEIYVAAEGFPPGRLFELLSGLQIIPRAVRLIPEQSVAQLLLMPVHNIGQIHAVELQKAPLGRSQLFLKRLIDLSLAIPIMLFVLPLFAVISFAIKLDTRGPVIFRQKRLGYRGEPFQILKFRSMKVQEDGDLIPQASKDDQRVTRVGRLLRKTSLDELPQLFNVIAGQMSLVGPRPHARAHDAFYAKLIDNYELRQHVRPGITGWAQVNGLRGETSDVELMRRRVEYDLWYAKNASIVLDLVILVWTIVEVLRRRNAH